MILGDQTTIGLTGAVSFLGAVGVDRALGLRVATAVGLKGALPFLGTVDVDRALGM